MYNVVVIGCGYMGKGHLDDIYLKENISILGVCDLDLEKAKLTATQYRAKLYSQDYKELVANDETDIVIIATYPSTHLEILECCIAHGKHVICEKPIATSLEEGRRFVQLVNENPQVKVLIGHILRHNQTYQIVADLIQEDAIGKPIVMRMTQNHQTKNWNKYLALIKETSPVIDCGVHYVDVMRWFTGADVVSVKGAGARTEDSVPSDKYNYGSIMVKLSDGSLGIYEVGWSHTFLTDNTKEFIGPKGRIKIIYQKDRSTHKENGNLIEIFRYPENEKELINVPYHQKPTGLQLDYLIRMMEENVPANPSIDDVYHSFETVCTADKMIVQDLIY